MFAENIRKDNDYFNFNQKLIFAVRYKSRNEKRMNTALKRKDAG